MQLRPFACAAALLLFGGTCAQQAELGTCMCDVTTLACDANCCCDPDCDEVTVRMVFTGCRKQQYGSKNGVRCVEKSLIPSGLEPMYVRRGSYESDRADEAREGEVATFEDAFGKSVLCVTTDNSDMDENTYPDPPLDPSWTELRTVVDQAPNRAVYWDGESSGGWSRRDRGDPGNLATLRPDLVGRVLPGPPHWYRAGDPVGALQFWPPDEAALLPVGLPAPFEVYGFCDPYAPARFLVQRPEPNQCSARGALEAICEGPELDAARWAFLALTPPLDASMSDTEVRAQSRAATVYVHNSKGELLLQRAFNAQRFLTGTADSATASPPVRTALVPVLPDGAECYEIGVSYLSTGLDEVPAATALACQEACFRNPACQAFVHFQRRCTLKAELTVQRTAADGAVSGPRDCSLPRAGCLIPNATLGGADIVSSPAANTIVCQAMCRAQPACTYFVYNQGVCHLKDTPDLDGLQRTSDGSVTGPAVCADPDAPTEAPKPPPGTDVSACWEYNVGYPGGDLNTIPEVTPAACNALCQVVPGCEAFVHHIGSCTLKAAMPDSRVPLAGAVAGPKVCIDAKPFSAVPTRSPQQSPTAPPTAAPSSAPTQATSPPTAAPANTTVAPTTSPVVGTAAPTANTGTPTAAPSRTPTAAPSTSPTVGPSGAPTSAPRAVPTASPTRSPQQSPTASPEASPAPVGAPSGSATVLRCRNAIVRTDVLVKYTVSYYPEWQSRLGLNGQPVAQQPTDLPAIFEAKELAINVTVADVEVPLGETATSVLQRHTVVWQQDDVTGTASPRHGVPGYRRGATIPLRVTDGDNAIDVAGGLQLYEGGPCAQRHLRPVRWLHDVTESGCYVTLTFPQLREQCVTAGADGFLGLVTAALPPILNRSAGVRLAADGSTDAPWLPVTDHPSETGQQTKPPSSLRRICPDAMVGYDITVVLRRVGKSYNPQDRIFGITRRPLRRDLVFRASDPETPQRFYLRSRLSFVRQDLDASVPDTVSPPLLPAVPDSIFFPFRVAGRRDPADISNDDL
eukprot:TRINITY_DN19393_c1_g1_i1.p1 TRINITY_DN19393_c1_g1~~TRINITY_DN19393_c1_g1_i1.p1  ORF type:complete len:1027 (+),score=294.65 TRINITY_DN19393_c1_g1_i1:55-3135(+)